MKKTFLTFVAVGFGASVAFAQTAEPIEVQQQEAPQMEQTQPSEDAMIQEEQGERKKVEMAELPSAVQEAFQNGAYSDMEIVAIYVEAPEEAAEATVFAFELAEKTEGAAASEMEGIETEQVSNRQSEVVVRIDENGQLIEEPADEIE